MLPMSIEKGHAMPQTNKHAGAPDWTAIADKRMSELTPAQQQDARELWLRNNAGYCASEEHVQFLLKRIDEERAAVAEMAMALQYLAALCSQPDMEWASLAQAVIQSNTTLAKHGFDTADTAETSNDTESARPAQ